MAVVLVAVDVEVDGGVDHGQQVGEVLRAVHPHRPVHRPLHQHPVSRAFGLLLVESGYYCFHIYESMKTLLNVKEVIVSSCFLQ